MRALLHGPARPDCPSRVAQGLGLAGMYTKKRASNRTREQARPANFRWPDEGDEPAARQPSPGGSPHRTADHHRVPEVEEPDGGVQRRKTSCRCDATGTGGQLPPAPRLFRDESKLGVCDPSLAAGWSVAQRLPTNDFDK